MTAEQHRILQDLYNLTDRAGILAAKIIRADHYDWHSPVLEPVYEGLRDFYEVEVWLRVLMHAVPGAFDYRLDGQHQTTPVLFGEGRTVAWIDDYSKACVEALNQLKVSSRAITNGKKSDSPNKRRSGEGKRKQNSMSGDARIKLVAALTKHHEYDNDSVGNPEPIGNNDLARAAGVAKSSASDFFKKEFEGHRKYKVLCRNSGKLATSLRLLNGEFSPDHLFGRCPPGEGNRDTDE